MNSASNLLALGATGQAGNLSLREWAKFERASGILGCNPRSPSRPEPQIGTPEKCLFAVVPHDFELLPWLKLGASG